MIEFTATGGANVGWVNATWPLASLHSTEKSLQLSVLLFGTYDFNPSQVSAITPFSLIPVLAQGVRIEHVRADYPKRVIFWTLGSPSKLIKRIRDAGFAPTAVPNAAALPSGFPLRWPAVIAIVAAWNALLGSDMLLGGSRNGPGLLSMCALLMVFCLSCGTLRSETLQNFLIREGHSLGEIRPALLLVSFVSGVMLVIFAVHLGWMPRIPTGD